MPVIAARQAREIAAEEAAAELGIADTSGWTWTSAFVRLRRAAGLPVYAVQVTWTEPKRLFGGGRSWSRIVEIGAESGQFVGIYGDDDGSDGGEAEDDGGIQPGRGGRMQ